MSRDDDKCLDERDDQPPSQGRVGENVIDHERPGEDESVGAPIGARMSPVGPLMGARIGLRGCKIQTDDRRSFCRGPDRTSRCNRAKAE